MTTTTRSAPASWAAAIAQWSIGRPQTGWRTFGVCDRIRVPWPAAMTSTVGREGTSRSVAPPGYAAILTPEMSGENVELLKRLTEVGRAGDLDTYFEFVADGVSGTDLRGAPDAPADFHNKQELREIWERFTAVFDGFTREVD